MIIETIKIENYLCYYDVNEFQFTDGLNIILADNGEGKTKFFEAVEWLFKGSLGEDNSYLISKKKISETNLGDSFDVRVELIASDNNERKVLKRSFKVTVDNENSLSIGSDHLDGIEEKLNGERIRVDGNRLLNYMFPQSIRRYSMFKGEEELNIFDNKDALMNLVNEFSDAKFYTKYEKLAYKLEELSDETVARETRALAKSESKLKDLQSSQSLIKKELIRFSELRDDCHLNKEKIKKQLEKTKRYIKQSLNLKTHTDRINKYEEEINLLKEGLFDDYTNCLFDNQWILMNFIPIHQKFSSKIDKYSKERRNIQRDHDQRIGERNQNIKLANRFLPLPENVPSKSHMEEMIKDNVCKVCNTPAPEGSQALEYMKKKLATFLASQNNLSDEDNENIFEYNYLSKLVVLRDNQEDNISDIKKIKPNIKKTFEENKWRSETINNLNLNIEKENLSISELIGEDLEKDSLERVAINFANWNQDLIDKQNEFDDFDAKVKRLTEELDSVNTEIGKIENETASQFVLDSREIFKKINRVFSDTKENKFQNFINQLDKKSNQIFKKINFESFTGEINFKLNKMQKANPVEITLEDSQGDVFRANKSLLTSMHISILLAISDLSKEVIDYKFPLIFDAPTSSFGEPKMKQFLNLINKVENQTIILTKDFIGKLPNGDLYIKDDFYNSVKGVNTFWVKLNRPFDFHNLDTISTSVNKI